LKSVSFSFLLIARWVLATTILFTLLGAIRILPHARAVGIEKLTLEKIAGAFILGFVMGMGIALAQWSVLRKFSISFKAWMLATAMGCALGWSLGVITDMIAMKF